MPRQERLIPRVIACCLLLLLVSGLPAAAQKHGHAPPAPAEARVRDEVLHSAALGRDMHYRVLLPAAVTSGGRFPVLYLLHGIYGDYLNWDTRTGLENYTRDLPLLIVMPDADDSWYTNSSAVPQDKFEDYVARDLITDVDKKYPTVQARYARAIAGLSMGGYGALKFGIKYPELFAFAGSLSGALNAAQNLDVLRPEFRASLLPAFGNAGSDSRAENDVFRLLDTPHQTPYPYFYLACGTSDFFLQTNRAFVQQLSSRKIAYEYHETAGGHAWDYWDRALPPLLKAVERTLSDSIPRASGG
jgi:S-formylglutathione hydrolase FrmB